MSAKAYADDAHTEKMETCLKAALAKHAGSIVSLKAEIENGKPIYDFDIKTTIGVKKA